jgi:hypothetical protein
MNVLHGTGEKCVGKLPVSTISAFEVEFRWEIPAFPTFHPLPRSCEKVVPLGHFRYPVAESSTVPHSLLLLLSLLSPEKKKKHSLVVRANQPQS